MMQVRCFFLIGIVFPCCFTLAFVTNVFAARNSRARFTYQPLFGVSEWKAKFSALKNHTADDAQSQGLPLLLFPFEPNQISLPGQHTKFTFRHGKFMDMIDESMTSYESVVGMSVLDEDGLLPIVVLCEVIEDEIDIRSGYRGFSSMEVGLRAVGRMKQAHEGIDLSNSSDSNVFHGRKTLNSIQIDQFVDYQDSPLLQFQIETFLGYLSNIESLLNLPPSFLRRPRDHGQLTDDQEIYADAHGYLASLVCDCQHNDILAASWAVFSLLDNDAKIPSVIIEVLSTTNAADRLRLGISVILDSRTRNFHVEHDEDNAFQ